MNKLTVDLGDRSYPIYVGRNLSEEITGTISHLISQGKKGAVLVDQEFFRAQPEFSNHLFNIIPQLVIPSGEASKCVEQLTKAWNFLADSSIDRSGYVVALGGGVVGDLTGFVSASYLRGISFFQVPTTLLAMVDSSVGGKTGINLDSGKNLVGSFHQPDCVWADLNILETLPSREFSAGMSEVIKYGMLADKNLFSFLHGRETPLSSSSKDLAALIEQCCAIKAEIVQADEKESHEKLKGRALLNLGHTFGHAIEKVAGYGSYLHGEAVAVGLVCALRLSQLLGKCQSVPIEHLLEILNSYDLPSSLFVPLSKKDLISAMSSDKKVNRGVLRLVVMEEIGDAFCTTAVSEEQIDRVWTSVGAV